MGGPAVQFRVPEVFQEGVQFLWGDIVFRLISLVDIGDQLAEVIGKPEGQFISGDRVPAFGNHFQDDFFEGEFGAIVSDFVEDDGEPVEFIAVGEAFEAEHLFESGDIQGFGAG